MTTTALPDKPSALIRVALADLEAIEKNPKYSINMNSWHSPASWSSEGKCFVCLAGAVMANTLKLPYDQEIAPSDLPVGAILNGHSDGTPEYELARANARKLRALNSFRLGEVTNAFADLGFPNPYSDEARALRRTHKAWGYSEDPPLFKAEMNKLADDLEAAGY